MQILLTSKTQLRLAVISYKNNLISSLTLMIQAAAAGSPAPGVAGRDDCAPIPAL